LKAAEHVPFNLNYDNVVLTSEVKYYFRRTYFMVDDSLFVELVALAAESKVRTENEEQLNCEVIDSDSREIYIDSCSKEFVSQLKENGIIKEAYPVTEEQLHQLKLEYKDNLFSISQDTITNLIKH